MGRPIRLRQPGWIEQVRRFNRTVTQRVGTLSEAIGLYRAAGYREVEAFNDEPYAHHWFEKRLKG